MKVKLVPVVGVTFVDTYPYNLHALRDLNIEAKQTGERLTALLICNPGNVHDANAVEVHVPALGEYAMIGHVGRENAARLAPLMDAGIAFAAEVAFVRILDGHTDKPGIDIAVSRAQVSV